MGNNHPQPIIEYSDELDFKCLVLKALGDMRAVNAASAVNIEDIICQVVYGTAVNVNHDIYLKWRECIVRTLYELRIENKVSYVFNNTQKWFVLPAVK